MLSLLVKGLPYSRTAISLQLLSIMKPNRWLNSLLTSAVISGVIRGRIGDFCCRVQLKRDGTRWRTGGEVKGKLANGMGSQYPSLPRNLEYPALLSLMRTPRLPVVDWTDGPADLNGLVRFAERQNMVSARVPSHFKHSLQFFCNIKRPTKNRGKWPHKTGTLSWKIPNLITILASNHTIYIYIYI